MTLAKVRPGDEAGLREVLGKIQQDHDTNPYLRFGESLRTHFARLVLIEKANGSHELLFIANHDGPTEDYLSELVAIGPGMDALWGACEGYTGPSSFSPVMRGWSCKARGVYVAFPGLTVTQVRHYVSVRQELEATFDLGLAGLSSDRVGSFLDRLAGLPRSRSLAVRLAQEVSDFRAGATETVRRSARRPVLGLARVFSQQGQASTFPLVHGGCNGDADRGRQREQAIQTAALGAGMVQNQMTVVTDVRPERLRRLCLALAGTAVLARFGWPPGEFADVGTLHWFAWSLLDGGQRLVFMSVYDGSWQNYMQDFNDKLIWGLDSLLGNTLGYPDAGTKDLVAFSDYVVSHQYPPEAFYSAYPSETVANLVRDRRIASALPTGRDVDRARRWLALL
jgi:hypothetical protein